MQSTKLVFVIYTFKKVKTNVSYGSFLDESPRWLLQKGDLAKAKDVLHKAAKINRTVLPPPQELDALLLQVAQVTD